MMSLPRDGDQFLLQLPGLVDLAQQPWGGQSPRVLTAAYKRSILKAQADKSVSDFVNADQYDLFEAVCKKAPAIYAGAPLLQRLPTRRVNHGHT